MIVFCSDLRLEMKPMDWMSDLMRPLRDGVRKNSSFLGLRNWASDRTSV